MITKESPLTIRHKQHLRLAAAAASRGGRFQGCGHRLNARQGRKLRAYTSEVQKRIMLFQDAVMRRAQFETLSP